MNWTHQLATSRALEIERIETSFFVWFIKGILKIDIRRAIPLALPPAGFLDDESLGCCSIGATCWLIPLATLNANSVAKPLPQKGFLDLSNATDSVIVRECHKATSSQAANLFSSIHWQVDISRVIAGFSVCDATGSFHIKLIAAFDCLTDRSNGIERKTSGTTQTTFDIVMGRLLKPQKSSIFT